MSFKSFDEFMTHPIYIFHFSIFTYYYNQKAMKIVLQRILNKKDTKELELIQALNFVLILCSFKLYKINIDCRFY